MTPPDLPADAPVADIGHPVKIGLFPVTADKSGCGPSVTASRAGSASGCHPHKPLFGQIGFDDIAGAVTMRHRYGFLDLAAQQSLFLEILKNFLARLKAVQPGIGAGIVIHLAVRTDDRDQFEIMALPHFEIVKIMCRCDFYGAAAKGRIRVFIRDDGDLAGPSAAGPPFCRSNAYSVHPRD